ncbi:MAG: SprB repeat-containing protein, partial [Flavobacteriales bacterium]|nr:SprB repeat-containing protein [Flavobacteriales bacterium]
GTPPYQYLWNDPAQQITSTAVNLCALTPYTLAVTDGNGCSSSANSTIGQPTPIEIDSTVVDSHCGQLDGSACISISGGIPGYSVEWLYNGSSNLCESGISAGTYLIEVTDLNDCPAQTSVTITDISGPTSSLTNITNVSCAAGTNGQATALVSGGTSPFSYLWSPATGNQITPTASNLAAGSYTYVIVDSAGCIASGVGIITEPPPITLTTFHADPICNGSADGIITTTVFGGVGPYTYSWPHDPLLTSPIALGLVAGTYPVLITDANGCVAMEVTTLTDPVPVSTSVSNTNLGCNSSCTGTASATPLTGSSPFSFQWNDGNQQTTQTATGLCAGTYQVIVLDVNGCTDTTSISVTEPDSLLSSISLSGNVSCNGFCDGYVEVAGSGGTLPYIYLWSTTDTTQLVQNLCPGNYVSLITDANGCTVSLFQTVTQPLPLNGTNITSDASCNGTCDGIAEYVLSGGVAPYTIQWNDPSFQTTPIASSLCAGSYSVIVLDQNGCSIIATTTVGQPSLLSMTTAITNSNCGQNNGMACVNVVGGIAPYTYQWNDPSNQSTGCALGLPAGNYNVVITDNNNCSVDTLINVTDLSGPTITLVNATNVTCNGLADGSITMSVVGGTLPYQVFHWVENSSGNTVGLPNDPTLNNFPAGCYTLEVTDNVGCTSFETYCILEPNPLNSTFINLNGVSCFSNCDGNATVLISGGSLPYNILWDNGQTVPIATGLCPGPHLANISDANGCATSVSVFITEPAPLTTVQVGSSTTLCNGTCDGVIQVISLGGTAPYSYVWSPAVSTTNMATGLCPGNYVLQTTDANGCQIITSYTVTSPTLLTGTILATSATCSLCNATSTLIPSGGTIPYVYAWQDGQTTGTALNVCEGAFEGTITDGNGCQLTLDITITNIPGPTITGINSTNLTCFGNNTGSATVTHTGGTAPITYLWSPSSQVSSTAVGLSAGNHCVEVIDANGCIVYDCSIITEPNLLEGVPDIDATICYGDSTLIWASAIGGTGPYTFQWLAPHASLSGPGPHYVSPTSNDDYCFDVTDANGCVSTVSACVTITVTPPL